MKINSSSSNKCSYSKKFFRSIMTTLIISSAEIYDIMKIVKSLEKSGLLIKSVSETIKNEAKEQLKRKRQLSRYVIT